MTTQNEEVDINNEFLKNQKWLGPKIVKYGSKFLGVYDLQISEDLNDADFLVMEKAFNEISRKLRYNEFRRLLWKGETECYQFMKPISQSDATLLKNGRKAIDLSITTSDLIDYARNRNMKKSSQVMSGNQVKQRKDRENVWKKWLEKREREDKEINQKKQEFLNKNVEILNLKYSDKLLPFQINHVKNLYGCLLNKGVALDASDTGTGKTYSALCIAKELGLMPIIVCPKSIIPGWRRAGKHFGFNDDQIFVSNYEQYRAGNTPYLRKGGTNPDYINFGKSKPPEPKQTLSISKSGHVANESRQFRDNLSKIPKTQFNWKLDKDRHILIFDECHKTKNTSTLNYALYWWARKKHEKSGVRILSLSATVADKIVNAYSICFMLGLTYCGGDFNMSYNLDLDKGVLKDFGYEVTDNGFYKFNRAYTALKDRLQNEDTNLKKLHDELFPMNGSRMKIEDLGDSFPENFVEAQTYDMDRRADQIQKIYQEMEKNILKSKLQHIEDKKSEIKKLEKIGMQNLSKSDIDRFQWLTKTLGSEQEKFDNLLAKFKKYGKSINIDHLNKTKMNDPDNLGRGESNMLTIMLRARQRVELLKADTLLELGTDFLEQGKSVVVFINFIETLEYLVKQFTPKIKKLNLENINNHHKRPNGKKASNSNKANNNSKHMTNGISIIRGGQTEDERQMAIDNFQSNKNRLILVTMGSGRESISLHDLEGGHPRVSLISPSWSAQDLIQALGRIHRAEGKSKCLQYLIFCAGTIEDRICELVSKKIDAINTINDGDLSSGLSIR
tara:strand:- start:2358 stop:4718 length:2361 start_codon:yes stop_codon:yes gene_type:complete